MIDGIDVATPQRYLNFAQAKTSGIRACYVKLGGDNAGRYVAPYYRQQVDQSRTQGFTTGHYWVPGSDPLSSADYFSSNIHNRQAGDFFVLDNEKLNSGRMYSDAEAAQWLTRVSRNLGVPMDAMFMYIGAADLRARTWPQCESLGIKVIVASYGADTGSRDHEPNMGGRFNNVWAGHQYTSNGYIGGVRIDLNLFQDWAFNYNEDFLMALSQYDQEYIRNNTVEAVERVRNIEKTINDISSRLRMPNYPFDYLPAISNNLVAATEAIKAIANEQGVDLDETDLKAISDQVSGAVQQSIVDTVKQAVIDALPNKDALTKEDVVDAIKSVTFKAE